MSKPLSFQTCTRLDEFLVIDLALQEMNGRKLWEYYDNAAKPGPKAPPEPSGFKTHGARISVWQDEEDAELCYAVGNGSLKKMIPSAVKWDADLLEFLDDLQGKVQKWIPKLQIRGEHTRNGQMFRAHPEYRGVHWRDWVLVDWGGDDSHFPAEIWCFVVLDGLPVPKKKNKKNNKVLHHGGIELQDGVYAVVENAYFTETQSINLANDDDQPAAPQHQEMKARLFVPIEKELSSAGQNGRGRKRRFFLADTEAFLDPMMVIPDIGGRKGLRYFQIKPRSQWVLQFEEWLEEPFPADYLVNKEGIFAD